MNKPNVQLKNVKMFKGHDGTGLNADIWINGINCMHVYDGAYGGEFEYTENIYENPKAEQVRININLLDDYIKTLLPKTNTVTGKPYSFKMNRDLFIDYLLEEQETAKINAKQDKKLNKLFQTALVIGVPNGKGYRYKNFKRPLSGFPKVYLELQVEQIKKAMYEGEEILNTNLEALGVTI